MKKFVALGIQDVDRLPQLEVLDKQRLMDIKVVSEIYPFRTNEYVLDELIDWEHWQTDAIFRLNFPQRQMLIDKDYERIVWARENLDKQEFDKVIYDIRSRLNPHPAGQMELNIPDLDSGKLKGIQHKYQKTLLFFPSQGQTCHAYCTFCFRWPQFVDNPALKIRTKEIEPMINYLSHNKQITDIIFTGGDPMIMNAKILNGYINPLLELDWIKSIRIGTKCLTYWPYRFVYDDDAEMILETFRKIVSAGKHLAIMAHFNHPAEFSSQSFRTAVQYVRSTGAEIRTQSPLLKNINNSPEIWQEMWEEQVRLGCIPYYMFLPRDTGAQHYFAESLSKALTIFRGAILKTTGLCRTVRGPVMSTLNGKVELLDYDENENMYTLRFIQHRNPELCYKIFHAKPKTGTPIWFDQLTYVRKEDAHFF